MKWLQRPYHRYQPAPPKTPVRTQKFDENSGQIYNETTVAIRSGDDRGWDRTGRVVVGPSYRDTGDYEVYLRNWRANKDTGDIDDYRNYMDSVKNSKVRGLRGARSLQDAAIECILQNISDITLEGIECLPVQIVRRVWHAVNKRCTACFNTWRIFAIVLRQESDLPTLDLLRFRHVIPNPISPLQVYTSPLISNSFEFLASLSITTPFPVPALCSLSSIKNLGILEIINSSYTNRMDVSDRVVRAWHTAASNEGAFQVLRIMKLWGWDEVTNNSLPFLNSFPSLSLYDVWNCGLGPDAELRAHQVGWSMIKFQDAIQFLDEKCSERVSSMNKVKKDGNKIAPVYSQPLWDASSVRRIHRSEVSTFLIQRDSLMGNGSSTKLDPYSKKPKLSEIKESSRRIGKRGEREARKDKSSQIQAPETWDYRTYTTFSRIGELREDLDLAKAGVAIGQQAIVTNQLINSVPLVSLCVGSTDPIMSKPKVDSLVFVRIQVPEKKVVRVEKNPPMASQFGKKVKPPKRSGHSVNNVKKRNLDDLLGSFM